MKGKGLTFIGWYLLLILFLVFSLLSLTGCKTVKYVEVEKIKTDTAYITKQQRDSIWMHDSIYIHEYVKNDTQYIERTKWHTKYVERLQVDTLYKATHDTIPAPYPVERQLTFSEKVRLDFGGYAIAFCFIFIILIIYKLITILRKRA